MYRNWSLNSPRFVPLGANQTQCGCQIWHPYRVVGVVQGRAGHHSIYFHWDNDVFSPKMTWVRWLAWLTDQFACCLISPNCINVIATRYERYQHWNMILCDDVFPHTCQWRCLEDVLNCWNCCLSQLYTYPQDLLNCWFCCIAQLKTLYSK